MEENYDLKRKMLARQFYDSHMEILIETRKTVDFNNEVDCLFLLQKFKYWQL